MLHAGEGTRENKMGAGHPRCLRELSGGRWGLQMGGGQRAEWHGVSGSQDGPGLLRHLIEVMGTLCEAAPLPWAILMTGSDTLHPRRGMSVSFGHLCSDQPGLPVRRVSGWCPS